MIGDEKKKKTLKKYFTELRNLKKYSKIKFVTSTINVNNFLPRIFSANNSNGTSNNSANACSSSTLPLLTFLQHILLFLPS